jgi:glyoxylase-like metal-dependent hydrolase (beta-lactamase superfamily II)
MLKSFYFSLILAAGFLSSQSQTKTDYHIYAIKFASVGNRPLSELASGGSKTDSVNLFFMTWLIEGNGKKILVDAGFSRELDWVKSMVWYKSPDSVLNEMDIKPDDITDIILTHPHADHINGIKLFPKAHIWMQKEDYGYFVGQAWQTGGQNGGFEKKDVNYIVNLNIEGKVTLVDGDNKELFPGITVYTGSRHTYNSQFVLVQSGSDKVILASDNIWIYYNLDHLISSPYMAGTFDTTAYVKSMQRMKTLASDDKYIIPGHDADVFKRFPMIKPDVVQIR